MPGYGYTKKGFTAAGFTTEGFDNYFSNLKFWRPRIKIFEHDGVTLLHDYNPFDNNDPEIIIDQCNVNHALNSPGTFALRINDVERNIDRSKVGDACKVVIQISQDGLGFHNIFSGYCERFVPMRDIRDGIKYGMRGFGSGIIFNEHYIDVNKAAMRQAFGSAKPDMNDPRMKVYALLKYIIEDADALDVPSSQSLQEIGGFDTSGIDRDIQEVLASWRMRHQTASAGIRSLIDRAGLLFEVNPYDKIIATYPEKYRSPVTIKTLDPDNTTNDLITDTSFFRGNWNYEIPIDTENFANCLIAVSGTEPKPGAIQPERGDEDDHTPCSEDNEEPCQEIPCTIPDLSHITLLLKKLGAIIKKFVTGILWGAFNGLPTKDKIATFKLDISNLVEGVVTPCFAMDIKKTTNSQIIMGNSVFCSIDPEGFFDRDNCIAWCHDGNDDDTKPTKSGGRKHQKPKPNQEGKPPFKVKNKNYSYNYATFYSTRTKVIVKNDQSIARYGRVEKFIDINWTKDFKIVRDILGIMLQYMSKPPMVFNTEQVTITSPPLNPGQSVRIVDAVAGIPEGVRQKAIVQSTNFNFDRFGENSIGTWFYEVGLQGLYDWLAVETPIYGNHPRLRCRPVLPAI